MDYKMFNIKSIKTKKILFWCNIVSAVYNVAGAIFFGTREVYSLMAICIAFSCASIAFTIWTLYKRTKRRKEIAQENANLYEVFRQRYLFNVFKKEKD